jgi:L-malate glycosyltransferase
MKEFVERLIIMINQDSSKIKICYLADAGSIPTQRWCKHFIQRCFEVHLISCRNIPIEGVSTHFINAGSIDVSGGI